MIKKKGSGATVSSSQDMSDIKSLESKSNTELLEVINDMMALPAEQIDMGLLDACLDILQKRAPVMENYDPQAEWEAFQDKHSLLLELGKKPSSQEVPSPKHARSRWVVRYAGTLVAAVLCIVVAAEAFGYHPVQSLIKWINDTVQVYTNPSGLMELPTDNPSEYHSLEEALDACGATSADRITWVPKDYSISSVRMSTISELIKISAIFESDRGDLVFRIFGLDGGEWNSIAEGSVEGIEYTRNGTTYYITSNYDFVKAGWQDEKYSYEISGQISEEEIKKMIDSIT